jgi:protein-disulfide isomerase
MRNAVLMIMALGLLPGVAAAEPLATVGKKTITRDEVEKAVRPQLVEIESQRYEIIRGGLDEMVAEALFTQEAEARKVTVEQLQQTEIVDKVAQPTDAEIKEVFDANKEQLGEATIDQVKPQIVEFLLRQSTAKRQAEVIAELKKKYPTKISMKAPVVEVAIGNAPVKGNPKAPVTIIEFSDYECPFCKRAEPTVAKVLSTYGPDKVRLAYRHFPLPFHANAKPAAEAAGCAGEQGKFWEYHEKVMASATLDPESLKKIGVEVGVDQKKFEECINGNKYEVVVDKDIAAGQEAGVNGTPAFFINGRMLVGAQPFEQFKNVIDDELASAK